MRKGILLQKTLDRGKFVIRYPQDGDAQAMLKFINTLSKEKTFIRFQGEQLTIKEEVKYLKKQLSKIEKGEAVQLLAFMNEKLVGVSSISMKDKVEKHVGGFGISVAKEYRGKGIGKLLMGAVFKEAKKNLATLKIVILTIYEKFGFIKYGNLPKGIIYKDNYFDDVLMYKPLK